MYIQDRVNHFENYMKNNNFSQKEIDYNIKVISILYLHVLEKAEKCLEDIDVYLFEEFTDKVDIIDGKLGGREGIDHILEAMLHLTEFLKEERLIKGGKIAYYRRIFKNKDYYIEKYDNLKGKKDTSKDFIKKITKNKLTYLFVRLLEDINTYSFSTMKKINDILDECIYKEEDKFLFEILENINLIEKKGKCYNYIVTKRGRKLGRLDPETKYGAVLYSLIYEVNWKAYSSNKGIDIGDFHEAITTICNIFIKSNSVTIPEETKSGINIINLDKECYRLNNILKSPIYYQLINHLFINMGILNKEGNTYTTTELGINIIKLIYNENAYVLKNKIESINESIKNKNYKKAEECIESFINVFGGNTAIWNSLGQILMIQKRFSEAYNILLYGYETSSKQGKVAKSILAHLITCCRNLHFEKEESLYEEKYNLIKNIKKS